MWKEVERGKGGERGKRREEWVNEEVGRGQGKEE